MNNYLLESTLSLIILLVVYHFFIEKEKMHYFKRFYLLFVIAYSLLAPLFTFTIENDLNASTIPMLPFSKMMTNQEIATKPIAFFGPQLLVLVYLFVVAALLFRFVKNILRMFQLIRSNKKVMYENSTLVLMHQETIPHSFLNYIFLNKTAFEQGKIENEILDHEMTHVRQKHTWDILMIEVLKIIFWFNPIFILYKKSIQLNHEFLADEAVNKKYQNPSFYQLLLLNANENKKDYLASNLNYLLTKKRFIMMTKSQNTSMIWIKKLGLIPLFSFLTYFLCVDLMAQEQSNVVQSPKMEFPNDALNAYYANTKVIFKNKQGKVVLEKKYTELSEQEKMKIPPPPPRPVRITLSEKLFSEFKNSEKFAVWVDGVHVKNTQLNNYRASDFVFYTNSHVFKNARSKKFPQENQVHLYSEKSFVESFENNEAANGTFIVELVSE